MSPKKRDLACEYKNKKGRARGKRKGIETWDRKTDRRKVEELYERRKDREKERE